MGRCSSCGAESDLEEYVCSNCDYHIKKERIEEIPFLNYIFKRPDTKWFKPNRRIVRLAQTIYNPAVAFHDINKKKNSGTIFILFFNALFLGLWGVAICIHSSNLIIAFPVFLALFLFGFFYYFVLFWFYDMVFSLAANFSVQLDGILAIRYNIQTKKGSLKELISGKKRLKRGTTEESLKLESAKQKKALKKIRQTGKYKIMRYAYAPTVVVNFLGFLLLLIGLKNVDSTAIASLFTLHTLDTFVWTLIYIIDALTISIWIPVLVSLALREIGNTSTTKLLIGNLIVGFLLSFLLFLLRPAVGAGEWNIIELFNK